MRLDVLSRVNGFVNTGRDLLSGLKDVSSSLPVAHQDRDIHDWYRAHYSHLPPGLAKRDRLPLGLERQLVVRGTLPPGLQKKMHLFDDTEG